MFPSSGYHEAAVLYNTMVNAYQTARLSHLRMRPL